MRHDSLLIDVGGEGGPGGKGGGASVAMFLYALCVCCLIVVVMFLARQYRSNSDGAVLYDVSLQGGNGGNGGRGGAGQYGSAGGLGYVYVVLFSKKKCILKELVFLKKNNI